MGALAALIRERARSAPLVKPRLRLVTLAAPEPGAFHLDDVSRNGHFRRIRWLSRAFRLQWLVDQATFSVPALECLEDAELSALLSDMERARECLRDDVSFEDAGLIRQRGAL